MSKKTARICRDFVSLNTCGMLASLSVEKDGFPFGSIVPYDIDSCGRVIIHAAKISQHYKNICHDSRASLTVMDQFGLHDPQAYARATILANFKIVADDEVEQVELSYSKRALKVVDRSIAHTFVFLRGEPHSVRWIGGFGDIRWIQAKDFCEVEADAVAYQAMEAIKHMNEDHKDALQDFVKADGRYDADSPYLEMVYLDRTGFVIAVGNSTERARLTLSFPESLDNPGEVRSAIVSMLSQARSKLN